MIIDRIEQAACYHGLHPGIRRALAYLAGTDPDALDTGRHAIDGDRIFALVDAYQTKPRELALWEAHRRYIDVQYILAGTEVMGYAPIGELQVSAAYDAAKDIIRLVGTGSFLTVPAGTFVVFFPHDAHMPSLAVSSPAPVRKIVIKVEA